MNELFSMTNSLNEEEMAAIKISFKRAKSSAFQDSFLMERLFEIICSKKEKIKNDKNLSELIYRENKPAAIAKLKSRLFAHILDVLSCDQLLNKDGFLDPSDRQTIRIKKRMVQFRILYRKKNKVDIAILLHLLNEIIKEAKEHELFDTLIEALLFKKYFLMSRKGFDEVRQIEHLISFYTDAHKTLIYSNDLYFKIITNQEIIQKTSKQEMLRILSSAITDLEHFVKDSNFSNIRYLKKFFKLELLLLQENYKEAEKECIDILNHIKNNKNLYKTEREGMFYDNLSLCLVYLGDHEKAIDYSLKAQMLYPHNSTHYLQSKQQEFFATFYSKQYTKALKIIEELLEMPMVNTGEFRHDKFILLKAWTLFLLNNYKEALKICNKSLSISKDKGRWDLGLRYLKIMCLLKLSDLDSAHDAIEALRKIISRNGKESQITLRDKEIFKCLYEYIKQKSAIKKNQKLEKLISQLSRKDINLSWKYYSHELAPIQDLLK